MYKDNKNWIKIYLTLSQFLNNYNNKWLNFGYLVKNNIY